MKTSEIANAAQAVINNTPAAPQNMEPAFQVSGQAFYGACTHIGTYPLSKVGMLRRSLWELQKNLKCIDPRYLPETVLLGKSTIDTMFQFLMECPCDQVWDTVSALEESLKKYSDEAAAKAQEAAAAKALEEAIARPLADQTVQPSAEVMSAEEMATTLEVNGLWAEPAMKPPQELLITNPSIGQ